MEGMRQFYSIVAHEDDHRTGQCAVQNWAEEQEFGCDLEGLETGRIEDERGRQPSGFARKGMAVYGIWKCYFVISMRSVHTQNTPHILVLTTLPRYSLLSTSGTNYEGCLLLLQEEFLLAKRGRRL